ncbi:glycerophosphodiester phosphodiesterase [Marinicauda algicola]|uniref:glycerophosphodiester phosphodiesterase n=1 Tax=Marinicauda algicola TaxID=2029849 RepID=A0A4S2H0Z5_9PROT|nr:glycerophosphodiester phosphodiesterase family protein [Marinicauda algicola]TGY88968.1 glycerophosphodiester phosphodiesterase [Marinicauda algicola]
MRATLTVLAMAGLAACGAPQTGGPAEAGWNTLDGEAPLVIAHRGASGLRPEHSLPAFELALRQGADVLEPDLQMSADGVLIVRHDPYLSTSTDIADRPEFAGRSVERFGREDWWVADFTAAELQTLRTRQVMEDRSDAHDGISPVLTFGDFLDFVSAEQAECGCTIAIEPEVKLPAEYTALGLDPLPALLAALEARGLDRADAPVVVQSFDAPFLMRLNEASEVRLAMLYSGEPGADASGLSLEEIARFADAVGPYKGVLMNPDGSSTGYLEAAHALGLEVHTWTVRDDREPLTGETVEDELRALYGLGVDGVFTDFPETAVRVRAEMAGQ